MTNAAKERVERAAMRLFNLERDALGMSAWKMTGGVHYSKPMTSLFRACARLYAQRRKP